MWAHLAFYNTQVLFWWGDSGERAFITILFWTLYIFYLHYSLFNTWNHRLSHRYVCVSEISEEWFLYILLLYVYRSLRDINYFCIYYTFLFSIKSFMRQKRDKNGIKYCMTGQLQWVHNTFYSPLINTKTVALKYLEACKISQPWVEVLTPLHNYLNSKICEQLAFGEDKTNVSHFMKIYLYFILKWKHSCLPRSGEHRGLG